MPGYRVRVERARDPGQNSNTAAAAATCWPIPILCPGAGWGRRPATRDGHRRARKAVMRPQMTSGRARRPHPDRPRPDQCDREPTPRHRHQARRAGTAHALRLVGLLVGRARAPRSAKRSVRRWLGCSHPSGQGHPGSLRPGRVQDASEYGPSKQHSQERCPLVGSDPAGSMRRDPTLLGRLPPRRAKPHRDAEVRHVVARFLADHCRRTRAQPAPADSPVTTRSTTALLLVDAEDRDRAIDGGRRTGRSARLRGGCPSRPWRAGLFVTDARVPSERAIASSRISAACAA